GRESRLGHCFDDYLHVLRRRVLLRHDSPIQRMSVMTIQASPYGFGNLPAVYGGPGTQDWRNYGVSSITTGIPPGVGTNWALWQVIGGGLIPGQAFSGMTFGGGCVFGADTPARVGTVFAEIGKAPTDIVGLGTPIGAVAADNNGHLLGGILTKAGLMSDDFLPPHSIYVGQVVNTNSIGSAVGNFIMGSLTFNFFFAESPGGAVNGVLTNPQPNYSPGKLYQQGFESL